MAAPDAVRAGELVRLARELLADPGVVMVSRDDLEATPDHHPAPARDLVAVPAGELAELRRVRSFARAYRNASRDRDGGRALAWQTILFETLDQAETGARRPAVIRAPGVRRPAGGA